MKTSPWADFGRLALAILAAGCATDPSDVEPRTYRLAANDSVNSATVQCFASTWQYVDGVPVRQDDCDIALRGFEARFDSTGPSPELAFSARVRHEDGDTATWRVGLPTTIQHSTLAYDFSRVVPLTEVQIFILPQAGTFVSGVMTVLMSTFSSNGLPDRTEYMRQDPSVFVLTPGGRPPARAPLATLYMGVAFAGQPPDNCTPASGDQPTRCAHRTFTLESSGGFWVATYGVVFTADGDTVGGMSVVARNLILRHPNVFVGLTSPGPANDPLRFDAQGSLVGNTLTLFPSYHSLDGTPIASPIVAVAQ